MSFVKGMFGFLFFLMGTSALAAETSARTNPDISVNALFLGRAGTGGKTAGTENANGFYVQEVEARFTSNVDTYFRGDVVLALEKEPGAEFKIEPEEVFVETLSLPSVTVKAGKFYSLLGRHNSLHTHSYPFIDAPLPHSKILGEEGLNEVGVSAAYLAPFPWYSEWVAQGATGENTTLFNSSQANDLAGVFTAKNLWDLSDSSTLEWDLSYGTGKNAYSGMTHLYSTALTVKWRPLEHSTDNAVLFTTEWLQSHRLGAPSDGVVGGMSSWVQWQMSRRWWMQGRGEFLGLPAPSEGITRKYSGLVGFIPTEYSALRLQYDHISQVAAENPEHRVTLQLNISMGTHPAHSY